MGINAFTKALKQNFSNVDITMALTTFIPSTYAAQEAGSKEPYISSNSDKNEEKHVYLTPPHWSSLTVLLLTSQDYLCLLPLIYKVLQLWQNTVSSHLFHLCDCISFPLSIEVSSLMYLYSVVAPDFLQPALFSVVFSFILKKQLIMYFFLRELMKIPIMVLIILHSILNIPTFLTVWVLRIKIFHLSQHH